MKNLLNKNKVVFFPGPAKTASSWFYKQFMSHKEVIVMDEAKDIDYKRYSIQDINKKICKCLNNHKLVVMINHDLLKHDGYDFLKSLNVDTYIVFRNSFDRMLSGVLEKVKIGALSSDDIKNAKQISNLNIVYKDFIYEENSYIYFCKQLLKNKIPFHIIEFNSLKKEKNIFNYFASKYGISIDQFKENIVVNKAGILSFSSLHKIIIIFVKRPLLLLGLESLWSKLKLSFIRNLFLKEIPFETKKKLELLLKHDPLVQKLIDEEKFIKKRYKKYFVTF